MQTDHAVTTLNRQTIDDDDMVARYLAHQLNDQEREAFEAFYLQHPEVLKELNRTAQFKSGLLDLRESGALQSILTAKSWWRRSTPWAIAASLIIAVFIGFLWNTTQQAAHPMMAASVSELSQGLQSKLAVVESRNLQRTRSSSYDATVQLPREQSAIELRIRPDGAEGFARYRVEIGVFDADGRPLTAASGVEPASDGFIPIYLDSSKFPPGVYELTVSGEEANGATASPSEFLIELTAAQVQ